MSCTRSVVIAFVTALGLSAAACSTLGVEDYCRYSEGRSIRDADPESLALVLGVKPERRMETPFVVIRSLSENKPGTSVTLRATPAAHPMPMSLDESACAGVDWSTFDLSVDAAEWHAFWQDGSSSPFEIGIAFLDDFRPLPLRDFGAAIIDTNAADHLVSCGCYWR